MKLERMNTSNKGKYTLYSLVGVAVALVFYMGINFHTAASVTEVRKELNLNDLR